MNGPTPFGAGQTSGRVWPTGTDYSRAVQSPQASFGDSTLQRGRPGMNAMGMPLVASGQNAVVFLIETDAGRQAIRCFLTPPSEGAVRYEALERHLVNTAPRALTAARWLNEGVSVGGQVWPVVVMPWVEGSPLNIAVEDMLPEPHRLRSLAQQWVEVVNALQRARVAHGDLQHGNVLVKENGTIALVDLDGIWVPEITIGPPAEFGHPNYQHPQRTSQHWGQYVDSFPAALIALALNALAVDPSLERFLNGENLLFTRADLESPATSAVWSALCTSPDAEVARTAVALREKCAGPIHAVLRPLDGLVDAAGVVVDEALTVLRSPAVAERPAPAVPAAAVTASATDWWHQTPPPAPTATGSPAPVAASAPPPPNAPPPPSAPPPPNSPSPPNSSVATAAASSPAVAPSTGGRVSPLMQLGRNTVVAGLVGGALAGVLGSWSTAAFDPLLNERGETVAFVAMIGLFLGGFLLSFQSLAARNWSAALRRFAMGAGAGALAGVIAILPANMVVLGLRHPRSCVTCTDASVPMVANVFVFAIIAACVGAALGALRNVRTALSSAGAGAFGGALGGLMFGVTVAKYDHTGELDVFFLKPTTMLVVALVCATIGVVYGAMVRARRVASLTIIEGRNNGLEIAVDGKQATIGSGARCDLVLPGDPKVLPAHASLALDVSSAVITLQGDVSCNGQQLASGATLVDGDVLMVGGSYIRLEFKEVGK